MSKRLKKLFGNSIVFAIGSLGSKIIGILMVPLYTYLLTTQMYGKIDLYLTVLSLIQPIGTLCVPDAVLRLVMEKDKENEKVMYNSVLLLCIGYSILFLLFVFSSFIVEFPKSLFIILLLQGIQLLLSQYIRGIGLVKQFAFNGILMSFTLGISNIILMYFFGMKLDGYLLSIVITNTISILYFLKYIELNKIFRIKYFSKGMINEILRYSVPLIPNGMIWWFITGVSRVFILKYLDISHNGLFAVSNKIPSLLIIFQTIFFQAWQLSAIEESDSQDSSTYTSEVYNIFSKFMFGTTLILIFVSRIVIVWSLPDSYSEAWKYVPFLLLGVLFSSFASFVGTQYLVEKKTVGMFMSTIVGAFFNVLSCYLLIPTIGLQGASIASFIGFLALYLYRLIHINKVSSFNVSVKSEIINLLILLLGTQVVMIENVFTSGLIFTILIIIFLILNQELIYLLKKISKLLVKRRI
ncbi:lipopolysaccharide biosynthesis protein [Vagococcus fluvialis]|nr:oligosaccharide flippase family protein [Vagococcus fluvialis]UDM78031.1 oligosaccharide flippase family protein [Vagococcus fluvialis]